jgi:hypothetical protein
MSQRSIVEINHDFNPQPMMGFAEAAHFVGLLSAALASGSDKSWEPLKRYGITRITQCHHSEDRKVVVGKREYPFG